MKRRSLLPLLFVLSLVGYACRDVRRELPLEVKLSPADSTDTTASVHLWGIDASRTDTLPFGADAPLLLEPDTTLYREILVAHAEGSQAHYFRLVDGVWQEGLSKQSDVAQDSLAKEGVIATNFSGWDVQQHYRTLSDLYLAHRTALVFSSPVSHTSLTKAEAKRLREAYTSDSLQFVYMMLHHSDSVVRRVLKQDSLRGIAFSDSLGVVSQARKDYGIARETRPVVFVVDSLGKMTRYKLNL